MLNKKPSVLAEALLTPIVKEGHMAPDADTAIDASWWLEVAETEDKTGIWVASALRAGGRR